MKQASPAQLAARAAFAARARAGAFKRKAKPTAKRATKGASPARKRNPVGPKDGPGAEYFVKVKGRGWVREYARNATPDRWRYTRSFADAQVFTEGQAVSIKTMCDHVMAPCELMEVREANPAKTRKPRSPNPAAALMPWGVFRGSVQIASFRTETKAKEYGQAYADTYRMPVSVGRVK